MKNDAIEMSDLLIYPMDTVLFEPSLKFYLHFVIEAQYNR